MQRGGVWVLDHERVEIVQALAEEHRDDVGLDDGRIVGPAEDFDRVGRERSAELQRVAARHHELGELDDDGDLLGLARSATRERLQVERAQQVAVDELERRPRLTHERLRRRLAPERVLQPVAPVLAATRRAHAPAAVVAQDDVVAREHDLLEKGREREELAAVRHDVEDAAVEQELRRRSGPEQVAHLVGPGGELVFGHLFTGIDGTRITRIADLLNPTVDRQPGEARLTRRAITGINTPRWSVRGVLIPVTARLARACGAAGPSPVPRERSETAIRVIRVPLCRH